jgi:large subunit ribosomal protein L10
MLKNEKPKKVEELVDRIKGYSVIGLISIHKMPAKTFQIIRKRLKGTAEIKVTKKTVIERSLEKTGTLEKMKHYVKGEQGLMLSNETPFRLFKILKENVSQASAKVGDIAPKDIVVQKGPTPIAPGPAISTFQKAGLKTTVQEGKIAVAQDKVVTKAGDEVTEEVASILNLLKIEPMEIGMDLVAALEDNILYTREILDVDTDDYIRSIEMSVQEMINLSLNVNYPTKDSIEAMLSKAFAESRSLAFEANIIDKNFIDDVLAKAAREAKALEELTNK